MAKVHYSNKHPFVVAVKWANRLLLKNVCYFSVLKANKSPEIAHAWLKADYEAAPTWRSAFTEIGSWNCTTVKMHVPVTVFAFYLQRLTVFIWKVLQNRWSCSQVARWKKWSFHFMLRHEMKASPAPGSLHQRKLGEKSRKRNPVDTLVLTHLHQEREQMMLWLKKVRVQYEITFIN